LGIIHRDIKPENILMCNKVIKLADLGISIKAKNCTQYCGTPGYMAPEVRHYKTYTNKIDCYSIGVLIYEMIHKKLPN
jgi:serine/threonine protein kinase